jgi:beta-ureidopropionase / N-carbamoyl-L-amino-acid hydrolase
VGTLQLTASEIRDAVLSQRPEVVALFDALREGSRDGEGITRDTYGPGEQFAHQLIAAHAGSMGLETHSDHASNLFMTLAGKNQSAPRLMTGSHLDSVANGGNAHGSHNPREAMEIDDFLLGAAVLTSWLAADAMS